MNPNTVSLKYGLRAVYILRDPDQPRPEQPPNTPPATERRKQAAARSRARGEELGLEGTTSD
jgi:hypothetical protein